MSVSDVVSLVLDAAQLLYAAVQQAEINVHLCRKLEGRVEAIVSSLTRFHLPLSPSIEPSARALVTCIQQCTAFIKVFSSYDLIVRLFEGTAQRVRFEQLNTQLSQLSSDLQLGLSVEMFETSKDREAAERDAKALETHTAAVIAERLNVRGMEHNQQLLQLGDRLNSVRYSLREMAASLRGVPLSHPLHGPVRRISFLELNLNERIGAGGYGTVFGGVWTTTQTRVAVKKLHCTDMDEEQLKCFAQELQIMYQVGAYEHVVTLLGAVVEPNNYCIVMELIPTGSLAHALHRRKHLAWTAVERCRVAYQLVKSLNFLHTHSPPVLHQDVKSANFLLDQRLHVRVCDFGLARTLPRSSPTEAAEHDDVGATWAGSLPWAAPEQLVLDQRRAYTQQSDVFSLGVVLWELVSGLIPYSGESNESIIQKVVRHETPAIPQSTPSYFRQWIEECWREVGTRPSCIELMDSINHKLRELEPQPTPTLHTPEQPLQRMEGGLLPVFPSTTSMTDIATPSPSMTSAYGRTMSSSPTKTMPSATAFDDLALPPMTRPPIADGSTMPSSLERGTRVLKHNDGGGQRECRIWLKKQSAGDEWIIRWESRKFSAKLRLCLSAPNNRIFIDGSSVFRGLMKSGISDDFATGSCAFTVHNPRKQRRDLEVVCETIQQREDWVKALKARAVPLTKDTTNIVNMSETAAFNVLCDDDVPLSQVVQLMQRYPNCLPLQQRGCDLLYHYSDDATSRSAMLAANVLVVLHLAMDCHQESVTIQQTAAATLCQLATDDDSRSRIFNDGSVHSITSGMERHRSAVAMQQQGCWLLWNLALCPAIRDSIPSMAAEPVVQAMKAHRDHVALHQQATATLDCLSRVRTGHTAMNGAIHPLLSSMKRHGANQLIVEHCTSALAHLAADERTQTGRCLDHDGLDIVLSTLKRHQDNLLVQHHGSKLLRFLVISLHSTPTDQRAVQTTGIITALLNAMRQISQRPDLHIVCLTSLLCVVQRLPLTRDLVSVMVPAVLGPGSPMRMHPKDVDVQQCGCNILLALSESPSCSRSVLHSAGAASTLLNTVTSHHQSAELQEVGVRLICYLAAESDFRSSIATSAGGAIPILVTCLRGHLSVQSLQGYIVQALVALLFDDVRKEQLIREGGVEALVDALSRPQSEEFRPSCESLATALSKYKEGELLMKALHTGLLVHQSMHQ